MIVNSYNQEFGYELLSSVPYAYELFLSGELEGTVSGLGSSPLYYFSPSHTEVSTPRGFQNTFLARRNGIPYTRIHTFERPPLTFPPYREVFANTEYAWKKPTLCICNRYNREWGYDPINYFDLEMLDWLFSRLKSRFEIVYFAVVLPNEIQDDNPSIHLDDVAVCKKHGIRVFQQIRKGWNESLLRVFANCNHFITMNGGYSILASLFGGTNIIYTNRQGAKRTNELLFNSFNRWYPNHSNQHVILATSYDQLKERVQTLLEGVQRVGIIIRGNGMESLRRCLDSVMSLSYSNLNPILISRNEPDIILSRTYPIRWCRELPEVKGYSITIDGNQEFTDRDAVSRILNGEPKENFINKICGDEHTDTPIPSNARSRERYSYILKLLTGNNG